MNYQETINWMFLQLPMYQRQGKVAFKKSLTNIISLADYLNNPEKKIKTIHVGGTNGKGSTSHMLASIFQEAGYKVGLYTSPHLKDFTERIRINGNPIRKNCVINFIKRNKVFLENQNLSFFEMTVGMAFDYFAKQKVDIAIIEVGLGGRLDSTNIINPIASVITNIGLDHTQMLGNTLKEIATEKAGIIKPNTPIIIGEEQQQIMSVFIKKAKECQSELFIASKNIKLGYITDLMGNYQQNNVKTVMQTIKVIQDRKWFTISDSNIKKGLLNVVKNTHLKGRWQILHNQPKVICDTAHNKEGLNYVMRQLKKQKYDRLHIILGVVKDKNLEEILPLFPVDAQYYFCKPNIPRGLNSQKLKGKASSFNLKGEEYKTVSQAYKKAIKNAHKNDLVYVGGSTFVVAEII